MHDKGWGSWNPLIMTFLHGTCQNCAAARAMNLGEMGEQLVDSSSACEHTQCTQCILLLHHIVFLPLACFLFFMKPYFQSWHMPTDTHASTKLSMHLFSSLFGNFFPPIFLFTTKAEVYIYSKELQVAFNQRIFHHVTCEN